MLYNEAIQRLLCLIWHFNAILGQIDSFSLAQKKTLIKALKKSALISLFKKKDKHLLESLIGIAGNEDISIEQIKSERLSAKSKSERHSTIYRKNASTV